MVDVTLAVMGSVASHDLSKDPQKQARRLRRGDVVDIHLSSDLADLVGGVYRFREPISSPRLVFIHIKAVPNNIARKLKERLTVGITEIAGPGPLTDPTLAPITHVRRRRFRIPPSIIPTGARNKLNTDKEVTVDWATFRDKIREKVVVDKLDASKDDESSAVKDADLI